MKFPNEAKIPTKLSKVIGVILANAKSYKAAELASKWSANIIVVLIYLSVCINLICYKLSPLVIFEFIYLIHRLNINY